tara:strand:+ start:1 stop:1008 length:1008 start_codon:yes stop_codon:yes gene_type:complete
MRFAENSIVSTITSSAVYGIESPFGGGYQPEAPINLIKANAGDNGVIITSGSQPFNIEAVFNFFDCETSSSTQQSSHPGRDRNLISIKTSFDDKLYNERNLREKNNISILGYNSVSGTIHLPYKESSSIHFRNEISNLYEYKDPDKVWGTTYNDTNFVQYSDFVGNNDSASLDVLNSFHYETRYTFLTVGDTQRVSGSALSKSGSLFTQFASESFFSGIELIKVNKSDSLRENGTTVRLIDTNAKGGIKNTNTGSNFGLYLDERYRYPNNHLNIIGKSNTETPSFKNSFFKGVQNGSETTRDNYVYSDVPEVQDLNSASFYTVNVTGENTITVGG